MAFFLDLLLNQSFPIYPCAELFFSFSIIWKENQYGDVFCFTSAWQSGFVIWFSPSDEHWLPLLSLSTIKNGFDCFQSHKETSIIKRTRRRAPLPLGTFFVIRSTREQRIWLKRTSIVVLRYRETARLALHPSSSTWSISRARFESIDDASRSQLPQRSVFIGMKTHQVVWHDLATLDDAEILDVLQAENRDWLDFSLPAALRMMVYFKKFDDYPASLRLMRTIASRKRIQW